jgi:hypothetical protein
MSLGRACGFAAKKLCAVTKAGHFHVDQHQEFFQ